MTTTTPAAERALFDRGRLTDWLLEFLTGQLAPGVLVGDGEAPEAGGWPGGDIGQGDFVPYITLATGAGAPAGANLGSREADEWELRYSILSFGGQRKQADWVADQARTFWTSIRDARIDVGTAKQWRARRFTVRALGGVTRNDQVRPPYWQVADEMVLFLTPCRT